MFGNKKYPILTPAIFTTMHRLCTAVEVAIEMRTRIVSLDLNTGRGTLHLSLGQKVAVMLDDHFQPDARGFYHFALNERGNRFEARFDEMTGKVQVRSLLRPLKRKRDGATMWWAGYFADDRWPELLESQLILKPEVGDLEEVEEMDEV